MGKLSDLLFVLYEYSLKIDFLEERKLAKEIFFIATGSVHESDPWYEDRMACFQDFFVFDYRLSNVFSGATIFETFLYNINLQKNIELEKIYEFESLRDMNHSLYLVRNIIIESGFPKKLKVQDLFSGLYYFIEAFENFVFSGLNIDQIFEGRRFFFNDTHYISKSLIIYPEKVTKTIENEIKLFKNKGMYFHYKNKISWNDEISYRENLTHIIETQKNQIEGRDKIKSVNFLNVSKNIFKIPKKIESNHLLMWDIQERFSAPFIPSSFFYHFKTLIYHFAYCEIKRSIYKHIDPQKIFSSQFDEESI